MKVNREKHLMNRFSLFSALLFVLLAGLFPANPATGAQDPMKELAKALQSQLQKVLFEQYIRYDRRKNMVSFSPLVMQMAVDKLKSSLGDTLQTFDLKPVGNALNFSIALKSGTRVSASIVPESMELGLDEMAIVGLLPQGLKIEGVDLPKTVSGFFDNLFGSSPAPSSDSTVSTTSTDTPTSTTSVPQSSSNSAATSILKNFSIEGNTFRLRRPLKSSILGRALSASRAKTADGRTATGSQRLSLNLTDGWLNLNLGDFNPEKVLLQFTTETLLKQLQGK